MFVYLTQIRKTTKHEAMFRYWNADDLGGYQMESRDYFISNKEIVKTLKQPYIKNIGHRRKTYIFEDL